MTEILLEIGPQLAEFLRFAAFTVVIHIMVQAYTAISIHKEEPVEAYDVSEDGVV